MMSTSATVPGSNDTNAPQTRYVPPSRRRDKPQVVCNSCRRRKLKCDRGRPCDNCTRRGLGISCTYVQSLSTAAEPMKRSEPYAGVQDRIVQLESLVTTLMHSKGKRVTVPPVVAPSSAPRPAALDDPTQLSDSFGHINLDHSETSYADSSHWKAVLDEISELKDYFEDVNESVGVYGPNTGTDDPEVYDSLLGQHESATKEEILASMPARQTVDRLLATFFNQANMAPGTFVLHCPSFLKKYEAFWKDPNAVSAMWLGQLFGIMCLALAYQQYNGGEPGPESRALIPIYRTRIIQCLILGQYIKCGEGTLEALLIYMQVEYMRQQDTQTDVWVLLGIIVRLALRMGYHRDPSHEPSISPFDGEMRRRVWAVIHQFDIVTSAQFGLPRMIRDVQTDTRAPLNLTDGDISEEMPELPPARAANDHTIIQFWTQKSKLVVIFGNISELMASVRPFPYAEVMELDKQLNDAYRSIPAEFLPKPSSQTILDPPELLLGRAFVEVLHQKSRCVLHRKYMFAGKTNPAFSYSRITAIDGALNVLQAQADLDVECQPDGRLHNNRWKLGSIVKHEFLLATTILCLYLNQEAMESPSAGAYESEADVALRARVIIRLSNQYVIWYRLAEVSEEAKKAVQALRLVLGKAQKRDFKGSEAIAPAMAAAKNRGPLGPREKGLPAMFTPPSSNGSAGTASNGQSPEFMDLSDVPVVSSTVTLDPAESIDLFDMETWDLGDFNDTMDGFYDLDMSTLLGS